MPALAKLVSSATAPRRSKTVTAWPSAASSYAVVTPMMPAPMTATLKGARSGAGGWSCAARRRQRGLGRQSCIEQLVVVHRPMPEHQADGQGAGRVAGDGDGAAVEHVHHAGVAQQERVDAEERFVAVGAGRH